MPDRPLYFDTSAIVPVYIPEVFSVQATRSMAMPGLRIVSCLTLTEAAAACCAKYKRGGMFLADAERACAAFFRHVRLGMFMCRDVGTEHFTRAAELVWAVACPLRTLDALHLAIAEAVEGTLVSGDDRLLAAADEVGLPTVDYRIL